MVTPTSFTIRMYNVGFGDCLLLSFDYGLDVDNQPTDKSGNPRRKRHILFDHGSTSRARNRRTLGAIAKQIATDTEGKLDALVVTHRHKDHLSGFGTKAGQAILDLRPDLVIRSWTEDPALAKDAGKPVSLAAASASIGAARGVRATNAQYLATISAGEQLAESIVKRGAEAGRSRTNLAQAADDAVTNAAAVTALDTLSDNGSGEYLYAGRKPDGTYQSTRLEGLLPGVKVRVLGPPRPSDWPDVVDQAQESSEFWTGAPTQVQRAFAAPTARSKGSLPPGTGRWIIDRLRDDEQRQLIGLVRWLDDVLNNTSVILLFEIDEHRLLFGGDAQIENWSWALKQAEDDLALRQSLAEVNVYKVGHHGSRNGTPKTLYNLWKAHNPDPAHFISLMSTKGDVHGEGDHTVPRRTLITALKERGRLISTDDDDFADFDWVEISAAASSPEFTVTSGRIA